MIVIVAEKADMGAKIAAALDKITLPSGKTISFSQLGANEKTIKAQQTKDGFLKIRFNGQECYVTWGLGHLVELKHAKDYNPAYRSWKNIPLPFIPAVYETKVKEGARTERQFDVVKELINKADVVVNATDYDREGELIFDYIYNQAKCKKPVKRAIYSSNTQKALQESFNKLKDIREFANICAAGHMRSIADYVVGINLTTAMSLKRPGEHYEPVGRVQTAALNMAVVREKEIRAFKSTPYWTIDAVFTTPSGEEYKAKHHEEKIESLKAANAIMAKINGHNGVVADVQKKRGMKEIPLLFSLSALQMEANSKFGFTLSETLDIAQRLYDKGYTTYPRTNSQYLTDDMEPEVNHVLDEISNIPAYKALISGRPRKFDRKRFFDSSKVESHFAIIPTGEIPTGLSDHDAKVYDMICRSVIRMLYGPAIIEHTKVVTRVNDEAFHSSGSVVIDPGWMAVSAGKKDEIHPAVKVGDTCKGAYTLSEKQTKPPERYTDKSFLAAMLAAGKTLDDAALRKILSDPKTGGIGTEATRADILEKLVGVGFIERKGKMLYATDKGISLIDRLPLDTLKSAEITAKWEMRLNNIANGKESAEDFRRDVENMTRIWVKEIEDKVKMIEPVGYGGSRTGIGVNCPKCGAPIIQTKFGYGCSGWRSGCKFSIGTICGKSLTENQVKILISKKKSPLIKGFTSKAGKKFDAYLTLVGGDVKFEFPAK